MNPAIWGSHAWFFIHSITLAYPECPSDKDKKDIKDCFIAMGKVLPCYKCRVNFANHYKQKPLTDKILCSREKLIEWGFELHNLVNKVTHKPILTWDTFLNKYAGAYGHPSIQSGRRWKLVTTIIILMVTAAVVVYIVYLNK